MCDAAAAAADAHGRPMGHGRWASRDTRCQRRVAFAPLNKANTAWSTALPVVFLGVAAVFLVLVFCGGLCFLGFCGGLCFLVLFFCGI
jgi:hypothetical protein